MFCGNREPPIRELLLDPLVRLRMKSAGTAPGAVENLLRETKQKLRDGSGPWVTRKDSSNKPG